MSTTTVDTLLSCFVMITLVLSAMIGISAFVNPFLQERQSWQKTVINQEFAEYLLLHAGSPTNWGSDADASLTSFGLAEQSVATPFELDIDKVTRLNEDNAYNVSFWDVFTAFGAQDKPFRIKIEPVFNVTLNLTSQVDEGDQTVYYFDVYTKKSNFPIAASLSCYTVLGDYVVENSSSTPSSGVGSLKVTLPDSLNGTALLIVIAKIEPRTMSYATYSFKHNSAVDPYPQGTFVKLSPLNFTLKAELLYPDETSLSAKVFTYNYRFNLTKTSSETSIEYYDIPRLLDPSPMIIVMTGLNQSTSFAEWVAYPQIPLDFGSDFMGEHDLADSYSLSFLVTINSAVYECEVTLGGT